MKKLILFTLTITIVFSMTAHAQDIKWHAVVGGGLSDMRDFTGGMGDAGYGFIDSEGNPGTFNIKNKPDYMVSAGLGLSGSFSPNGLLGWRTELLLRHGGFRIFMDAGGKQAGDSDDNLPVAQFGQTESFRYWGLHAPLSITYKPFEVVGFTMGADLHYQLSADPSKAGENNYSDLDRHLGKSPYPFNATYNHPFNVGAHLGVFVPFGDRFQFDAKVFTDLGSRLRFNQANEDKKFQEMGVSISVLYNLDW